MEQKALSGTKYDGYKVVEGKSNRRYTDEAAVAFAVKDAGFDPYEKKLLGITCHAYPFPLFYRWSRP